ncbi:MAG TPA: hypothetical protein VMJ35_13090 [Dongiaceae bacterium]|nr:hypothetical protein [Dongiaceae bacterium]
MRVVRIEIIHPRNKAPLVLRARFERTFFGFGLCIAGALLAGGAYLLADAIREPLEASEASVLVAGLALALGAFAILFLLWPRGHLAIAHRNELERFDDEWKNYVLTAYGESVQNRLEARSLIEEHKDDLPGPM